MLKVYLILISFLLCSPCWGHDMYQEGVMLFHEKKYDQALQVFERKDVYEERPIETLIGKLFCSIALGKLEEIDSRIALIDQKLKESAPCSHSSQNKPLTPEEQQKAYLCRQKVRAIADEMRQTVELLVRETVSGFFKKIRVLRQLYPFIDSIEYHGLDCCQHNPSSWDCCLEPLLQQLETWNNFGLGLSE